MDEKKRLSMGCGKGYRDGWVNLDGSPHVRTDVLHNLDVFPYPFPDNSFDEIDCADVIEHLADVVRVMEEVHRILKPGGVITLTTPHYSCSNSFTDPTHRHHLGLFSFDYFTQENQWDFYTRARFRKVGVYLKFYGRYKNRLWEMLANRFPGFYEEHLAWIAPAWYIVFRLEALK